MKRILLSLAFLMASSFALFAQDNEPTDTTSNTGGYSIGSPPDSTVVDGKKVVVDFKIGQTDTTKNITTRWFTLGLG